MAVDAVPEAVDLRQSRAGALLPAGLLLLAFAAVAAVLYSGAGGSRYVTNDEATYILLGRSLATDPLSFFTVNSGRGLERGVALLSMVAASVTGSATGQLQVLHLLMAIVQALVTVPIYLTARLLGVSRWPSVAAAAIAATGSFAVYGAFALNTTPGVLAISLLLWATIRSVAKPGWPSDIAIIASAVLVGVARMGWLPLTAAAIPAVVAGAFLSAGGSPKARFRSLPSLVWRRNSLLVVFVGLAVLGLGVMLASGRFVSGYGTQILGQSIEIGWLWNNVVATVGGVAIAVAFIPLIFALPLVARDLFAARSAPTGALAWFSLSLFVLFMYVHYAATNEDRYLAVLAPCVVLSSAVALFKRPPLPVLAVGLSAVLVAAAVRADYMPYPEGNDPFSYFISPTSTFVSRAVFQRVTSYVPLGEAQVATLFLIGSAVIAVLIATLLTSPRSAAVRPRVLTGVAVVTVAGMLIFQLAAMYYPVRKYVAILGMEDVPASEVSFVDESSGGSGFTTRILAPNSQVPPDLFAQLPFLNSLNEKLGGNWNVGVSRGGRHARGEALVDPRNGSLRSIEGVPPKFVLFRAGYVPISLAGAGVQVPAKFAYAGLKRLARPVRAEWIITGAGPAGYASGRRPVRLLVFNPSGRPRCISGNILADPRIPVTVAARLVTPDGVGKMLSIESGQRVPFRVRVAASRSEVLLYSKRERLGAENVGTGFFDLQLGDCPGVG